MLVSLAESAISDKGVRSGRQYSFKKLFKEKNFNIILKYKIFVKLSSNYRNISKL